MTFTERWAGSRQRSLVGGPHQLVRIERAGLMDGPAAGSPILQVRNPAGISFEVTLDRGLDIGWADALGVPLAWAAPRGRMDARFFDPHGKGWATTFGGGLLTTCGLATTGAPSSQDGDEYGLHGRIGHTPAEQVGWDIHWDAPEPVIVITGSVLETALGAPSLLLHRTITASCERPALRVDDVVTNVGYRPAGHMFRHHFNFGYPLISPRVTLETDTAPAGTRGDRTPLPLPERLGVVAPQPVEEVVWYGEANSGAATINSPDTALTALLTWTTDTFPLLIVWRDASPGVNVLALEPSTSRDEGRAQAHADGELIELLPGASRSYSSSLTLVRSEPPTGVR